MLAPFDPATGFGAPEGRETMNVARDIALGEDFMMGVEHANGTLGVTCRRNDGTWTPHLPLGIPGTLGELGSRMLEIEVALSPSQVGVILVKLDDELWAATVE
jgi:hypothetical protein